MSDSDAPIEQATAAPGEKRNVRLPDPPAVVLCEVCGREFLSPVAFDAHDCEQADEA